jgi:hypothetical protein
MSTFFSRSPRALASAYLMLGDKQSDTECEFRVKGNHRASIKFSVCKQIRWNWVCGKPRDWNVMESFKKCETQDGIYTTTYGISILLTLTALVAIGLPIWVWTQQQFKGSDIKLEASALAAWTAILYGALITGVQNAWLKDWNWYDMLRSRRLVQYIKVGSKKGSKLSRIEKDLILSVVLGYSTFKEIIGQENTCAIPEVCTGKTKLSCGATLDKLMLVDRQAYLDEETQTYYVPAAYSNNNRLGITTVDAWQKGRILGNRMHLDEVVSKVNAITEEASGSMAVEGIDYADYDNKNIMYHL